MSLYQRFKDRFGTAGVVIGVIALILALGGSAIAAKGGLTGKQKKEVAKIAKKEAKKFAGKPGATGPAGTNGANGTNGKDGTNGTNGEKGEKGDTGSQGLQGIQGVHGKNVVVGTAPVGPGVGECEEGGATVEVEGEASTKKAVCNGLNGSGGGGEFPNFLPPEKTEEGAWSLTAVPTSETEAEDFSTISFGLPLETAPTYNLVPEETSGGANCPGTAAQPQAAPGNLCVYVELATSEEATPKPAGGGGSLFTGAHTYGAFLGTPAGVAQGEFALGTWAVTAPAAP
jgi:Collagen triple helix repeat (20 copies)